MTNTLHIKVVFELQFSSYSSLTPKEVLHTFFSRDIPSTTHIQTHTSPTSKVKESLKDCDFAFPITQAPVLTVLRRVHLHANARIFTKARLAGN